MSDTPTTDWEGHWQRYSIATRLNPGQILRRRLIFRLLGDAVEPGSAILDAGCGSGDLLAEIARRHPRARLAGVDRSGSGLGLTAKEVPGAQLAAYDLEGDGAPPHGLLAWADHATCSEVLEHVDDPVKTLRKLGTLLKPGARLVVTVPGGPMSAFDKAIGHRRHFTAASLDEALRAAGYRVEIAAAAGFPVFNLYRWVVIWRGARLAADIDGTPGLAARLAMAVFRWLMPLGRFDSRWGWQIVARATMPGPSAP